MYYKTAGKKIFKVAGWLIIFIIFIFFNYAGNTIFISPVVVTASIIIHSFLLYKKNFLKNIGLQIPQKHLLLAFTTLIISTLLMYFWVLKITAKLNVEYVSDLQSGYYDWFLYTFFRSLNEEILFGFLPLMWLSKHKLLQNKLLCSLFVAIVFTALHFIAYKWWFPRAGTLVFPVLVCLFSFSFIRNNFILGTGHIGFALAIHAGFAFVIFGGYFFEWWREYEIFNGLFGYWQTASVSLFFSLLSSFLFIKNFGRFPIWFK